MGSLYQYFPNKQALVEEVRTRFTARFEAALIDLLARLPGLSLRDAIRALVTTTVDLHTESPGVHNAIGTGSPAKFRDAVAAVVGGYLDAHASEIRRPDHHLAGRVFIDAAEALIHNTALSQPELLEDASWVAEICDLLERYLLVES